MMRRWMLGLFALLCLTGCGQPLPVDKKAYVGLWRGEQMTLLIGADGSLNYRRVQNGVTKTVQAPIKQFDAHGFSAGLGPFSTTFEVSRAPYQDGKQWKMVVDGVELVRANPPGAVSI